MVRSEKKGFKSTSSWLNKLVEQMRPILRDPLGAAGLVILLIFIILAIFASSVAPYRPFDYIRDSHGALLRLSPPSRLSIFGTNNQGQDIFSQVIYGARIALIIGALSAILAVFIGTNVGLIAGYHGRWIDEILMRITDVAFGIPFLPFALILVALLGPSNWNVVLVISLLLWRVTARVIRSQVLTLKQRPFIMAAKAAGASDLRLMYVHILPNILPFTFLYLAFGVAWGVMTEASLSFLGFGDPNTISWGRMLYTAFAAGAMREAWWWVIPPGAAISLLVVSSFLITRAYEEVLNPRLGKW